MNLTEALETVEKNAGPDWNSNADAALRSCAEAKPEFISDDVWSYGLSETHENRALGPVFLRAKKNGWIVKTDKLRMSNRARRASPMPIWRSLITKV